MKILRITVAGLIITVLLPLMIFNPGIAGVAVETFHTERSFNAAPGGTVKLDLAFHQIEVTVAETDKVSVNFSMKACGLNPKEALKRYRPVFRDENGTISVCSQSDQPMLSLWSQLSGKVQVRIPKNTSLDLHTSSGDCIIRGDLGDAGIQCNLSSGKLDIDGAMKDLSVYVDSGDVTVKAQRPIQSADINCDSGNIRLSGLIALAKIQDSSGNVDIDGLTGALRAEMDSGCLNAEWTSIRTGSQIDVRSSSGTVELSLPAETILSGEIATNSGQIHSDFPGMAHEENRFTYEDQRVGVGIHVDVSSGDVWVGKNNK